MICADKNVVFTEIQNLRHEKIHEDIRFTCNIDFFDASYTSQDDLRNHQNAKHNETAPYRCHGCQKEFAWWQMYGKHVKECVSLRKRKRIPSQAENEPRLPENDFLRDSSNVTTKL